MPKYTKRSNRATDESYVVFENGVTNTVSAALLHAKLGIADSIRIRKEEYDDINFHLAYFTHFNLQYGGMKVGKRYALPKILVQGYFRNEEDELPPLLSYENCLSGTCVRVMENVPYADLTEIDFRYSMSSIQNAEELKNAIVQRYKVSMPLLTEEEIISMGVSVTTLRLDDTRIIGNASDIL